MVRTDILERSAGSPTIAKITGDDYKGLKLDLRNLSWAREGGNLQNWNAGLEPVKDTLGRAGVNDVVSVHEGESGYVLAPREGQELIIKAIRCHTSSRRITNGNRHIATGRRHSVTGVRLEIRPRG